MAIYHLISNKREFGIIVLLKATMQKILLDLADFALQDQQQFNGLYYSGTPLYGHPVNTDTPLLRTVWHSPTKRSYISLKNNPLNTDTR